MAGGGQPNRAGTENQEEEEEKFGPQLIAKLAVGVCGDPFGF